VDPIDLPFAKRTLANGLDVLVHEDHHVPIVAVIHQVAREIWRYETPWPISVLGRYLLEPTWLRAYRDVPVVTVSESSRESLAEYGLRRVTVVPEGWVAA